MVNKRVNLKNKMEKESLINSQLFAKTTDDSENSTLDLKDEILDDSKKERKNYYISQRLIALMDIMCAFSRAQGKKINYTMIIEDALENYIPEEYKLIYEKNKAKVSNISK